MPSTTTRKKARRLQPWASPLIDDLGGGTERGRESCTKSMSTAKDSNNKRVAFDDIMPSRCPPHRCHNDNNITTTTTSCESHRTDIALWNIRNLQRSIRKYRTRLCHERIEARLAVMEAQQVHNEVHNMLDAHYPFVKLEEELHDSFSSLENSSSSSILSLSSSSDDNKTTKNEEEMMNQMLHSFLDNLIEEASPIHSNYY